MGEDRRHDPRQEHRLRHGAHGPEAGGHPQGGQAGPQHRDLAKQAGIQHPARSPARRRGGVRHRIC